MYIRFKILISTVFLFAYTSYCQTDPVLDDIEKNIENAESSLDFLDLVEQIEYVHSHGIDINTSKASELLATKVLSPIQVFEIIKHRQQFGNFLNFYELQVVPSLSDSTIKKLIPFIKKSNFNIPKWNFKLGTASLNGEITSAINKDFPKAIGYDKAQVENTYIGTAFKNSLRIRIGNEKYTQFNLTAEKDEGEAFFNSKNSRNPYDFLSANLVLNHIIHHNLKLIIGDFQASYGQGLTIGNGLGFGKSALTLQTKRTQIGARPYRSVNEVNFMRGIAAIFKNKNFDIQIYTNRIKQDALLNIDSNELDNSNETFFESIQQTGLHRTESELKNKNKLQQTQFGTAIQYTSKYGKIGFLNQYTSFDAKLNADTNKYNQYYYRGSQFFKSGIHYDFVFRNFNFFGETIISSNKAIAVLNGIVASFGKHLDISILYRHYPKHFIFYGSNAFSENTNPVNESGLYSGFALNFNKKNKLSGYLDMYKFPWLNYQSYSPSKGYDYLLEYLMAFNRSNQLYFRYRFENKYKNQSNINESDLIPYQKQAFRIHYDKKISLNMSFKTRVEWSRYTLNQNNSSNGFMAYQDFRFNTNILKQKFKPTFRIMYFNTQDYNSRIYVYENDILYTYAIPAFYDIGWRYYILLEFQSKHKITFWIKYGLNNFFDKKTIGSGKDAVQSSTKSDLKFQVRYQF